MTKKEYNEEPVLYCERCLSLRIRNINDEIDFCDNCGSADILETDIGTWEKLYFEKYGHYYIDKDKKDK